MNLSKSLYTGGLQCTKSLWAKEEHKQDVLSPPDITAAAILVLVIRLGALACELFPDGVEIPFYNTTFEGETTLT